MVTSYFSQIAIPYKMNNSSSSMVAGPDGNIWLIGEVSGLLMRVTPQGKLTGFTYKERFGGGNLWQLIAGPGKTLWACDPFEGHTLLRFALRTL